jgi:hypothetical protein
MIESMPAQLLDRRAGIGHQAEHPSLCVLELYLRHTFFSLLSFSILEA